MALQSWRHQQTESYSVDHQVLTVADRDVVKTESKQVFKKKKAMHTLLYQWDLLKMPQPHLSKEDKQGHGAGCAMCLHW